MLRCKTYFLHNPPKTEDEKYAYDIIQKAYWINEKKSKCLIIKRETSWLKITIRNSKTHKRKAVGVIKSAIKKFFSFILAILISVIFGGCLIFLLPFDYIKYKRSLYYKNTKKKYTFFDASNDNFKIYNEINKNNLPINFIHHPKEKSLVYGWFVFEKTLIIVNAFNFEYDAESGRWVF